MNETEVIAAAKKTINDLLEYEVVDKIERLNIHAKISLAQIALFAPLASIGTCTVNSCNTNLHYEGRDSGLYLCCTGSPKHCWQIK